MDEEECEDHEDDVRERADTRDRDADELINETRRRTAYGI